MKESKRKRIERLCDQQAEKIAHIHGSSQGEYREKRTRYGNKLDRLENKLINS
ncbi:MAG: hypothetical protein IJ837_02940 [Clostridia bacterium]|nr:hypothetical protein [Clostridia bacterium]